MNELFDKAERLIDDIYNRPYSRIERIEKLSSTIKSLKILVDANRNSDIVVGRYQKIIVRFNLLKNKYVPSYMR